MALLAMCGFDDSALENTFQTTQPNTRLAGRDGIGQSFTNTSGYSALNWSPPLGNNSVNTIYLNFAVFTPINANLTYNMYLWDTTSNKSVRIANMTNGLLLQVGNLSSPYPVYVANTWSFFEYKIVPATGFIYISVKYNGQTVIDNASISITGMNGWNQFQWNMSNPMRLDDLVLSDNTGPAPYNDSLGDCFVRTLLPTNNGSSSQFTNSAGNSVNNYSYVDEVNSSSTDYVGANTAGLRDLYSAAAQTNPIENNYLVKALQGLVYAAKSDSGTPPDLSFSAQGAVGGIRDDTTKLNLGVGYLSESSEFQFLDPDGNALTPTSVNNMSIGVVTS